MPSQTLLRDVGWKLQEHRPDYANLTRLLSSSLAKDRGKPGPNISNHAPFIGVGTQSLENRSGHIQPYCFHGPGHNIAATPGRTAPARLPWGLWHTIARKPSRASFPARLHTGTAGQHRRTRRRSLAAGPAARGNPLPREPESVARRFSGRPGPWP